MSVWTEDGIIAPFSELDETSSEFALFLGAAWIQARGGGGETIMGLGPVEVPAGL